MNTHRSLSRAEAFYRITLIVWDYYETRDRPFWVDPLVNWAAKRAYGSKS